MFRIAFIFSVFLANIAFSTELKPWFGDQLEFEFRPSILYQSYQRIESGDCTIRKSSDDLFLNLSLANSPLPEISLELEATFAKTRHKSNCFDNIRLTGNYLFLDDVAGDPCSFVMGITLGTASEGALHDISSFHHGIVEGELHASVGKERSCGEMWISRWWAVGAIGMADRGSPWLRGILEYDWHMGEKNEFNAYTHILCGLGSQDIHVYCFKGYGPIQHQSIDLGLRYVYHCDSFGDLRIGYAYRPYARNFPANTHLVTVEIVYPFPL